MRPTSSFSAKKPMISYQTALRLAEGGKSKRELGRADELAQRYLRLHLGHILFRAVRMVGPTVEVTKARANIEVPIRTAVGTARISTWFAAFGLAAQVCGALRQF